MSLRRRPPPLARRAIAALLVGFWMAALVGSLVHGESHEHRYCAQHKAFEEVGARRSSASTPSDSSSWQAGASGNLQHQACAFAELGVRAPLDELPRIDVERPVPPELATTPALAPVASPIPLLANAPKASPPVSIV
jgi:hypothetical protein